MDEYRGHEDWQEGLDPAAQKARWMEAGDGAFDDEDYERALEAYNQASRLDKRDSKLWATIGLCYSNLGLNREAWRSFKLSLQVNTGEATPLWYAGEFLYNMGDYPLAAVFLSRYIELEQEAEYRDEGIRLFNETRRHLSREDDLGALQSELAAGLSSGPQISAEEEGTPDVQLDTGGAGSSAGRNLIATWRGRGNPGAGPPATSSANANTQVDSPAADEEDEGSAEGTEDEIVWNDAESGAFVADLGLQLTGFAGKCSFCSTMIPLDAPYCYICGRPHFYPED